MKTVRGLTAVIMLLLSGGWGSTGHRIINGEATRHLPPELSAFVARKSWLADSSSVPDWRRSGYNGYGPDASEGPKHYIDVDDYPEHLTRSVPTGLSALIAQYGSFRVNGNGLLPWAVGETVDSLTAQMLRSDWGRVWSTAADLGHYVGDAHNPLHCTVDYNGRSSLPGSNGIHSRYESSMVNRHSSSLTIVVDSVEYVADPVAFSFNFVYDAQALVDSLYAADLTARSATGWNGSGSVPTAYLDQLWSRWGPATQAQFQKATEALASLIYSAWVDAGSPALPQITTVRSPVSAPDAFSLHAPYPNPFNPTTTIEWDMERPSDILLEVIGVDGKIVAVLAEGRVDAGKNRAQLDADRHQLASGVYFVRLTGRDQATVSVRKLIFLR